MSKKAAFITIHGMGSTEPDYDKELIKELKDRLGDKFTSLHIGKVYYQKILQDNENRVWNLVAKRLKWDALRKFLLFGFADAAGLENGKEKLDSVYSQAQTLLAHQLWLAFQAMDGNGPVVILAQSLGCQVASCYFWDANQSITKPVNVGIWQDISHFESQISNGTNLSEEEIKFIKGNSLHTLYTTGCNIPIFVAAHAITDINPIHPNPTFKWHNFYDKDDVLGWPLADLSPAYSQIVQDDPINAGGGGVFGWLLKSWNPLSHGQYWGDDEVLDPLEELLQSLLL